ncbi:MAG TPA: class I tRNA ligase family protein, partial [Bryobacteraceae bacterium]
MSAPTETKKNYKDTLNLPQTAFAMEAKLVQNEPKRLEKWQAMGLYDRILESRAGCELWVLHDGPPFANGDIHIGHVVNKTLKDVFLRFRTMQGFRAPYVPGWDCHGLPIEHKIQQDLGPKLREMSVLDVRKRCFAYAQKYADIQSKQFQRLGILGEWANPYLTMAPSYEASTLEVFARFVESGLVYKQLKPVHWSIANQTALADAELEYKDVEGPSVYVEFPAVKEGKLAEIAGNAPLFFLIWTTTPWTLPANLAIAVHPDVQYRLVEYVKNGHTRLGIVAEDLVERVFKDRKGIDRYRVIETPFNGADLVTQKARYTHPFVNRTSPILAADYVTTTDGTGLVHTAPGHGEEDYLLGGNNGLEVYCPVLANGRFDESVPAWLHGMLVWDANPVITKHLADTGFLLGEEKITHSYPHDWRSKTPTIFRATEQWFVAIDKPYAVPGEKSTPRSLRQRAMEAAGNSIEFVPEWGRQRMAGMLESR